MERSKTEILAHLNAIIEKKNYLVTNLNNIVREVEKAVELITIAEPTELKRSKHILNVLKYELTFMQLLSEMTYTCDTFLEEEEPPVLNHIRSSVPSRSYSRTSSSCEEQSSTDVDIAALKEQCQLLNEKYPTSGPPVLAYVTDFYNNCSSISRHSLPLLAKNVKNEVPEKDFAKPENLFLVQKRDSLTMFENLLGTNVQRQQYDSLIETNDEELIHDEPLIDLDTTPIDLSISPNDNSKTTVVEVTENTTLELTEQIEKSCENKPTTNCIPAGDSSESDIEIIEIMDKGSLAENVSSEATSTRNDTSSTSSNNSIVCTAVAKLNNLKVFDRREEALKMLNPVHIPDLSLKPSNSEKTHTVVKNPFDKSKKQKDTNHNAHNLSILVDVDLKECDLPKDNQECVFSHIESPSEFYLHLVNNEYIKLIDTISEQIAEFYDDSAPPFKTKTEARARVKKYCVAYVADSWYRVEIVDWFMQNPARNDDVFVYLVDFGDKQKVPYTTLRHMPSKVAHIPKLATKCHFVCLYPPESTSNNLLETWPTASIEALANLSGIYSKDTCKFFRFTYVDKIGDSLAVDLVNDSDDDSIGQILLDISLAVQILDQYPVDEDANLGTFLQDADNLVEADDIVEAIQGYSAKDESRICKFFRQGKTCYRGAKCQFEHIKVKDGYTTDRMYVHMDALARILLPDLGSQVTILITGFIDLCRFYVHIVRDPIHINNYLVDRSLYNLVELMNNIDLTKIYTQFKIWPAVGEIVAVKHWATKKWLRAKIRHLIMEEDGTPKGAQLFIVDFGEIVDVPLTNVRQINEDFLHLPFQAVEAYLGDAQQRKNVDKSEVQNFFNENMSFRNFVATIKSTSEPLRLSINTFKNINITATLIKVELAEPRTNDVYPAEESLVSPE